jgi:hypothetical protein
VKQKLRVLIAVLVTLSNIPDVSAQTRGRSYNPPSRSSSSSRGPRYNPSRRSSSGSSHHTSSMPRHHTPSNRSSSSNASRLSISTPRGPRYNPPSSTTPRGPNYNPYRYSSPSHHQPIVVRPGLFIYPTPSSYYAHIHRIYIYRRWVNQPVTNSCEACLQHHDGYPYYVHNGFRHRYNPIETCKYELVDGQDNSTVRVFPETSCSAAYDTCAAERDTMTETLGSTRYFCAEAVDKEFEQPDTSSYQVTPVEITEEQQKKIDNFFQKKDIIDVFTEGSTHNVGNCRIVKYGGLFMGGNSFGCKYVIKVSGQAFPMTDESICSSTEQAKSMSCDISTQAVNAGCILTEAIKAGYCL